MSREIVIDPLIFELQQQGGISRVWRTLLPMLPSQGFALYVLGQGGTWLPPARIRRFIKFRSRVSLFVPTYLRPCAEGIPNVQVIHDCMKELLYKKVKACAVRSRRRIVLERATCIIAVSDAT